MDAEVRQEKHKIGARKEHFGIVSHRQDEADQQKRGEDRTATPQPGLDRGHKGVVPGGQWDARGKDDQDHLGTGRVTLAALDALVR